MAKRNYAKDLKSIINLDPDGIIIVNSQGKIIYSNPAAEKLFGYSKNRLKDKDFGIPIIKKRTSEISINNKKRRKIVEMRCVNINWRGEKSVLISLQDITAKKKSIELIKKKVNELKKLSKKKNEFISIASHEIKTPATAIHGFARLLQKKDVSRNNKLRSEYISYILENSTHLNRIIGNLLDLSRLELGILSLNYSQVDIIKIIEKIRHQIRFSLSQKKITMDYLIENKIPVIYTDEDKLREILCNLINNAIHHTKECGKVQIKAKKNKNSILFKVTDSGIGIEEKNLRKIFQQFYQVDSSPSRKVGGIGLGLSLCKGYVEAMGGKIWVTSKIGIGSTFQFTLPIKKRGKNGKIKTDNGCGR